MSITIENNKPLNGVVRAICYSGFREGQHPDRGEGAVYPSYEETLEDLLILEKNNFNLIRLYDSGFNSEMVLKVIEEHNLPIKVMLGTWLKAEISNHETCVWMKSPISEDELIHNKQCNLEELVRTITLVNRYSDIVVAVNVGNEILVDWNDHGVPVESVITYVIAIKKSITQPVTVADNIEWWISDGRELVNEIDFISVHSYGIWCGTDIDEGIEMTFRDMKRIEEAYPGKQFVLAEAGWATIGDEFGDRASEEKQKRYFEEVLAWAEENHTTFFMFEAFDEPWKGNPVKPNGAEKHWGLFGVDRKPKLVMADKRITLEV